jgi:hypothetical protein
MPYEELVANASPEVQDFDRRLVDWARSNGWEMRYTPATLQVTDADTGRGVAFCPEWEAVEVSLTPLYESGLTPLAEHILERLNAIADDPLTDRSPKVPISTVLRHWPWFFERIVPAYVTALASADARRAAAPA